ncbi:MAG TPA: glycosyltransferase, partial [Blastocatellia bacterium]|nr:glycosyltransferase [Blastocatellia bacterium]
SRVEPFLAKLFFQLQLIRLSAERVIGKMSGPGARRRVMATACWSFPIYSQTFVYQELTQLMRRGFDLRFIYSKLDREQSLPSQFARLWRAKRRLILHPSVCEQSYAYFLERMPGKIDALVDMLCRASGLTPQELRSHLHFHQAFAFARMVEAYRPDYLHSYFFYEGTLFALIASYLLDIPRGVSCYADHMLKDYDLKVVPLHLRQSSLVIATSQQIKRELMGIEGRANPNIIIVKPNAINAAQFPVVSRRRPEKRRAYHLTCVSRIEPKKGLIYLVEAVGHLRQRNIDVELHLIGGVDDSLSSKEYARELEARVKELKLDGAVHLEGRKTESEIKRLFRLSHQFVAPFVETECGDKDGIPTSLLEAMASGLPIVATDAGSIREVIEDGRDGVLVPQRDSRALAAAIADLIADPERCDLLGQNAARKARERFDVAACEHIFHDRLSKLLASRRRMNGALAGKGDSRRGPVVSVIMIFFNAEKFISEAIESVLGQTYDDWELLLVDDGSTDGGTRTALRYVERYPDKVRYLEHEGHQNRGMSATRNLGIRNARGEYVAFLDADDVWLPHKLERQVAILKSHPEAAMACGAAEYWHSWTGNEQDNQRDHVPELGIQADTLFEPPSLTTLLYPLGKGTAPCPSDLMMRRSMVERIGGFEEGYRGKYQLYEDQAFLAKVYLNEAVFMSSECLVKYRIHPDSCVSTVTESGQYHFVRQFFLNWFEEYLSRHGIEDPGVSGALRAALSQYRDPHPARLCGQNATSSQQAFEDSAREEVKLGALRRVTPISRNWGFDRGLPIDRHYIEAFLARRAQDIRGRVLEIEDDMYTRKFGNGAVLATDVLHVNEKNPRATIIADLTSADHVPSDTFDCIILTQTLHIIYDTRAALGTLHRILKPGGTLLATFPGITRISHDEWSGSWFWGFTTASTKRLFDETFPGANIDVQAHGNVLAAISFLHGLAVEDLSPEELDYFDPDYEVLITVRAEKARASR